LRCWLFSVLCGCSAVATLFYDCPVIMTHLELIEALKKEAEESPINPYHAKLMLFAAETIAKCYIKVDLSESD
jgi:hypothetical protein